MKCQSPEKHATEREKVASVCLIDTHSDTHTLAVVMDGYNISIGARGRQSFHPLAQSASPPRARRQERDGGEKRNKKHEWWDEIFQRSHEKSPHLKTPGMSEVLNPPINSRLGTLSQCVIAQGGGIWGAN